MPRVLVVDDSGVMRKIIVRSLDKVGFSNADEAADGQEALEKFNQGQYDLVLTDWNMPVKDGLQLVKDIRATGSTVPIIMVTTESERERVVEALQAGANDYLAKPFEADTLREKLKKYSYA
jgi:two-component system chemotaxis response regulator CheY